MKPDLVTHAQNCKCSQNEGHISKMLLFPIAWDDEVMRKWVD